MKINISSSYLQLLNMLHFLNVYPIKKNNIKKNNIKNNNIKNNNIKKSNANEKSVSLKKS
jgi:hypothetical protein